LDQSYIEILAKKIHDIQGLSFSELKEKNQDLGVRVDPLSQAELKLVHSDRFFAANLFDHTILSPSASFDQVEEVCGDAILNRFYSVCVSSYNLPVAVKILSGGPTKAISVVGFPVGNILTSVKAKEAAAVVDDGAKEIDMVINVAALQSEAYGEVFYDIFSVVEAAKGKPVKVILETYLLDPDQIILGCLLAAKAGAAFVKTSTGFFGGASLESVRLMSQVVGGIMGIKASGGIGNWENFIEYLKAGATRIGASASCQVLEDRFRDQAMA
jgi:deoxyribose-phosphate aldolase